MTKTKFVEIKSRFPKNKIVFWITLGLFIIIQVFFTIETATLGAKLASLEKEKELLVKEGQEVSGALIKETSLSAIGQQAEKLGFLKAPKTLFIKADESVAKTP